MVLPLLKLCFLILPVLKPAPFGLKFSLLVLTLLPTTEDEEVTDGKGGRQ